jgi:hypothetical protein
MLVVVVTAAFITPALGYSAGRSVIRLQPRISSVNVIQSPRLELDHQPTERTPLLG